MNESEPAGGEAADDGDEQLIELLRELIRTEGQPETAALLGVSERTLQRTLASGRLTERMRHVLELRRLAARHEAAQARVRALEGQVAALTSELHEARGKPAPVEAASADASGPETPDPVAPERAVAPPAVPGMEQPVIGRRPAAQPRRPFPELVTLEAEEGEELVYGKAAPLIAEWRRVRAGHLDECRSRVEQATDWVRMCELELALISEHELTLPPDSYPWDRFQRRDELRRREQWLGYARAERRRALAWRFLRRVVTFGRRRR
ncbi:MAG: hypothetical protein OXG61_05125 [Chloroflexi bacterium]|nr:hypothetical protein [Chloroflexota bacterium]